MSERGVAESSYRKSVCRKRASRKRLGGKGFSENFAPFPFYIKNLFVENENDSVWCASLLECLWPKKDDDVKKQARISLMKKQLEEKDEDDLTWAEFSGIIGKKLKN